MIDSNLPYCTVPSEVYGSVYLCAWRYVSCVLKKLRPFVCIVRVRRGCFNHDHSVSTREQAPINSEARSASLITGGIFGRTWMRKWNGSSHLARTCHPRWVWPQTFSSGPNQVVSRKCTFRRCIRAPSGFLSSRSLPGLCANHSVYNLAGSNENKVE